MNRELIEARWRLGDTVTGWTELATELTEGGFSPQAKWGEVIVVLHYECPGGGLRAACGESLMFKPNFSPSVMAKAAAHVCSRCLSLYEAEQEAG